jgi:Reverse transcriptase (RNA-dependent DNA polymerase)
MADRNRIAVPVSATQASDGISWIIISKKVNKMKTALRNNLWPLGVPSSTRIRFPSSSTPALSHFWISRTTRRSAIRCSMNFTSHLCGSASPLLANVYLHYVFDLWVQAWRQKRAHGDVIVVRFADDIVVGFNSKADADQFRAELTERMQKFNLELHPEKTRSVRMRSTNGSGVEKGNRRRSTFSDLRTSA